MNFSRNLTKIIFGKKKRKFINNIIKSNKKILIICSKRGKKEILKDECFNFLKKNEIFWVNNITPNPTTTSVKSIIKKIRNKKFNFIIAYGGGSTIDTAKAIKLFSSLDKNYPIKKVIKNIQNLKKANHTKLIALPTTSGTGSEVTCYSTIWDNRKKKKLSLNHSFLYPNYAVVDPELTYDLGLDQTIYTGLDALNQAFESVWNKNSTKTTLKYASQSIISGMRGLHILNDNINHKNSRYMMAKSSLYSGICISKTRTCICHSISYPLTAYHGVPHGLACAFSMLEVIKYLIRKDKNYFKSLFKNTKYFSNKIFLKEFKNLFFKLKIKQRIKSYKISYKKILPLLSEMYTPERADNFPIKINDKFIKMILRKSLN